MISSNFNWSLVEPKRVPDKQFIELFRLFWYTAQKTQYWASDDEDGKENKTKKGFTPLHPESSSLQAGDEWQIKFESTRKPRPLGRGVTGFT